MAEFNGQFAPIEIPPTVVADVDNDYDLPYSAPVFE